MNSEVKAYMESLGFTKMYKSSMWIGFGSDGFVTDRQATIFYNATRKAKVEVLEAVKAKAPADKSWHFSPNDFKQGFNEANAEWRQAIDSMIKRNAPNAAQEK